MTLCLHSTVSRLNGSIGPERDPFDIDGAMVVLSFACSDVAHVQSMRVSFSRLLFRFSDTVICCHKPSPLLRIQVVVSTLYFERLPQRIFLRSQILEWIEILHLIDENLSGFGDPDVQHIQETNRISVCGVIRGATEKLAFLCEVSQWRTTDGHPLSV